MNHENEIADWGRLYASEYLSQRVQDLIAIARMNLAFGPSRIDHTWRTTWPGFLTACDEIRTALDDLGDVWIDTFAGSGWTDTEPTWVEEIDHEPDDCDDDGCVCRIAQLPEDWLHLKRADAISAIVGRELAPYVR